MFLKKKIIATAAVIAMAAAALYGSTMELGSQEDGESMSWFGRRESIYFWYTDDSLTNYINSAAVSFGEQEGVRVIPILTSDSQYLEAINEASLHSEQVPDVYMISNDSLEKAYLAGLASRVEDAAGICNEEYFPPAALSAVSYQGKMVGYPLFYETSALVYNQTYLEEWANQQARWELSGGAEGEAQDGDGALDEAAVAAKTAEYLQNAVPTSVDDILSIANSFELPQEVEGIMKWDVSDIFYNYWIVGRYMNVGGDAGDDVNNISINNPETIQCLGVYQALHQFFYIESDTVTYDSVIQEFLDGKLVFTVATTDVVKRLEDAKADGSFPYEYGIATMPAVNGELDSRSLSVTNAIAVNGYSSNKELANKFAAYLCGEYVGNLYERTGKAAANRTVNTDNSGLQTFQQEYAESVSLPKMMETGNFWIQLEILFSKVWNGEDITTLITALDSQIAMQVESEAGE